MHKQFSWLIRSAGVVVLVAAGAACSRTTPIIKVTAEGSGSMSEVTAAMSEQPTVKGAVEGKEVVLGDQPNEQEE